MDHCGRNLNELNKFEPNLNLGEVGVVIDAHNMPFELFSAVQAMQVLADLLTDDHVVCVFAQACFEYIVSVRFGAVRVQAKLAHFVQVF